MKTSNPEVKMLMLDILTFTDDMVEQQGKEQRERRTTIYKGVYGGYQELKKQLTDSMEIAIAPNSEKIEQDKIEWVVREKINLEDMKKENKQFLVITGTNQNIERHTESEIELSEKGLEALRYYAKQRDELPPISPESYTEFEKIIQGVN